MLGDLVKPVEQTVEQSRKTHDKTYILTILLLIKVHVTQCIYIHTDGGEKQKLVNNSYSSYHQSSYWQGLPEY